jgi:hypothetical protein
VDGAEDGVGGDVVDDAVAGPDEDARPRLACLFTGLVSAAVVHDEDARDVPPEPPDDGADAPRASIRGNEGGGRDDH